MDDLNRRRFLALAGLSTAGIAAGGLSVVPGQDKGNKKQLLTKERPPVKLPDLGGTNFEIRVQATGNMEVLSSSGLSFGSFSPAEAGGLYDFALPHTVWAERDKLDAGATANRLAADVPELMAGVPAPFVPLALHPLTSASTADTYSVGVLVVPQVDAKSALSSPSISDDDVYNPAWSVGKTVANYHIRASVHRHYLRGCINRDVQHVSILLHQVNPLTGRQIRQVFDLHVAAWWQGNRPCFAVYESESTFCRNSCEYPTWDRIARFVNELAASRGIPSWLSWTVAAAVGVVALGGLTVIPGVPPPP